MIGEEVGRYQIVEKLGEGGMGEVYLAEDSELHRKVALKFLPSHVSQDVALNTRFKHEAKAAATLNHPNIITIYDIGEHEGKPFIAMEYMDGKSLKVLLQQEELSFERIVNITSQISAGLSEAHQHDITHRDIKPDNILIDKKERIKIADFGLAKVRGRTKVTDTGSTLGTINYMSPEQLRGSEVDRRSDIWSMGVMLYEMITGRLPFSGEYKEAISYSILQYTPEPLARYKTGVTEGWQRIIDKALDKDINTRYQSLDDLLADIKREKRDSSPTVNLAADKKEIKRKIAPTYWIAIVIVALTVLVSVTVLTDRKSADTLKSIHRQNTFTGDVYNPTISPDGQFIAYQIKKHDKYCLLVREMAGGEPLEIFSGSEYPEDAIWSPDGTRLIMGAPINGKHQTYIIPRLGGKPQVLPEYGAITCWSPEGTHFAGYYGQTKKILVTERSTGDTISIPLKGEFIAIRGVDWSPTGDQFAVLTSSEEKNSIWTIRKNGTNPHVVVNDSAGLFSPRWSKKGDAIYYFRLFNDCDAIDLMKIEVDESGYAAGQPILLKSGLEADYSFTLSQDNKYLLYNRRLVFSHMWQVELTPDLLIKNTTKLLSGTSAITGISISPDGQKIATGYNCNIHVMPIEGGQNHQISFLKSMSFSPVWSPDSEEIAFVSIASENKIWRTDASGGRLRQYKKTNAAYSIPLLSWAPGKGIIYTRPGFRVFHLLNPETEDERQIGSEGWRFTPKTSPDGKMIAFFWNRHDGNKRLPDGGIWLLSLEDNSERLLYRGFVNVIGWTSDGQWIYAWDLTTNPTEILKISAIDGHLKNKVTLPIGKVNTSSGMAMTPDGNKIICVVNDQIADAWILENFDSDLATN